MKAETVLFSCIIGIIIGLVAWAFTDETYRCKDGTLQKQVQDFWVSTRQPCETK